jgi:molybdopterin-dependent oxidoreductase alpha subunit
VGGDLALLNAVQKLLIERGAQSQDFIAQATTGFEALRRELERQDLEALLAIAGVTRRQAEELADELAAADRGILVWSMGITQHAHGGDTVRAIVNLGLLLEYVGRPGAGLMPIRGHSGVQGGAEMGCYATALPGGVPIDAHSAAHFSEVWGFTVPASPGLTTTEWFDSAQRGEWQGLYCIGGNFLETLPDPAGVERALARIPLRIHSDLVLTTQMLVEPQDTVYLLPARTRYEQKDGGTETSTERRVIFSPHIPGHDVGQATSEWELLAAFARAVKPQGVEALRLESGASIRRDIAAAVPAYAEIAGLSRAGDQFQWGGPRLCEGGRFPTADGKAHFQPVSPPQLAQWDGADRVEAATTFRLATRRGKQFNSMIQRALDPLTGAERDHIFIAPEDAARLGVSTGDGLRLRSATGEFRGRAFVAPVAPGTLQGHWPEMNVLVAPGVIEPSGGVPDYNAEVTLERDGRPS